jgi:CrcB protein
VAAPNENRDIPAHPNGVTERPAQRRAVSPRHGERVPLSVLLAVGCGGVVGAISRYLVQLALPSDPGRFPTGTFIVNLSGSALLGFLLVVINERFADRRLARPLLGTGLIGAYTTFSTFTVEAVLLARAGRLPTAVAYVTLSIVLGLGTGLLGMSAGRLSMRRLTDAVEAER